MEAYSAIERITLMTWVNLQNVMLSEGNQTQTTTYCMIPFTWHSRKDKIVGAGIDPYKEACEHRYGMFCTLIVVVVTQQCTPVKTHCCTLFFLFFFFRQRGEGRKKERERNINVWLPLTRPILGSWPATQARALTGNQTGNLSVCRTTPNPLSHTG